MDDFLRVQRGFTEAAEGGYVNDAADPGGETNLGITKRVWVAWCQKNNLPIKPMRNLTKADVEPIYRAQYWEPLAARYPWPKSAVIYDCSVNSGVGDANPFDEGGNEAGASWMVWRGQQLCPNGTPLQQALAICDARKEFYAAVVRNRPASQKFWNGWMKRLEQLRAWVIANAAPNNARRVFLYTGTQYILWDGKPGGIYGGLPLGEALFAQLDLAYPKPIKTTYQNVKLERAADGAYLLNKF